MNVKYHVREAKKIVDRLEEGILKMFKAADMDTLHIVYPIVGIRASRVNQNILT